VTVQTPDAERRAVLADLLRQLPQLSGRGRERTEAAIRQVEAELAPGRAREAEAVNRR
jgi:hypothetical protein